MTKINRNALLNRGFSQGEIGSFFKSKWIDKTSFSIQIRINKLDQIEYLDLDCYIMDSEQGYCKSLPIPIDTSLEDLDHLIRILKL